MANRRPSKAEIRRRVQAQLTETPAPALPAAIAAKVAAYTPRELDPAVWERIKPFVVDVLCRYEPTAEASAAQRLTALTAFAAWADERDYPLERSGLLTVEHIEAFTSTAPLGKTAAANYRSRLRGVVRKVNPAGAGAAASVKVAHRAVKPPYTRVEIAAIVRIARTQPSANVGRQLKACVGLGLGAGLDSEDLKPLCARDVVDLGEAGIRVEVPGSRSRTVWVRREYEQMVRDGIAGVAASRLVIGTSATRRNVASKVFEHAHILGDAPHFEQSRMRTTWLGWLLSSRVPLPVIMDAAGLSSARTLTDLLPLIELEPGNEGTWLRGEGR